MSIRVHRKRYHRSCVPGQQFLGLRARRLQVEFTFDRECRPALEVFGGLREDQGKLVNFWPSLADNDFSNGPNYSGYIVSSNFPGNPARWCDAQQQFNVLHACDALAQLRSASGLGLAAPAEEQQNRGAGRLRPVLLAYYRQ